MSFQSVYAADPETIIKVDRSRVIAHVNRAQSPIFTTAAVPGARLADVLAPESRDTIFDLIADAETAGGALGEHRSGHEVYRVTARPLASSGMTLLIFRSVDDDSERPTTLVISPLTTD